MAALVNIDFVLEKVAALEVHARLMQEIAADLKAIIADPKPRKRKQSGLTEEKKARLEQRRMSTILKSFNR